MARSIKSKVVRVVAALDQKPKLRDGVLAHYQGEKAPAPLVPLRSVLDPQVVLHLRTRESIQVLTHAEALAFADAIQWCSTFAETSEAHSPRIQQIWTLSGTLLGTDRVSVAWCPCPVENVRITIGDCKGIASFLRQGGPVEVLMVEPLLALRREDGSVVGSPQTLHTGPLLDMDLDRYKGETLAVFRIPLGTWKRARLQAGKVWGTVHIAAQTGLTLAFPSGAVSVPATMIQAPAEAATYRLGDPSRLRVLEQLAGRGLASEEMLMTFQQQNRGGYTHCSNQSRNVLFIWGR